MTGKEGRALALVRQTALGFLEEVKDGTAYRLERDALYERFAEIVFAYWAAKLNHPLAILDEKREKRILARLRENSGDWGELCFAVDGALRDEYLMGRDPRAQRKYDGIETIFRDRAQVERLAEMGLRGRKVHPLVEKYRLTPPVQGELGV